MKWVAIAFSRGSSLGIEPRSPALQADSLPSEPPGKPDEYYGRLLNDRRFISPNTYAPFQGDFAALSH